MKQLINYTPNTPNTPNKVHNENVGNINQTLETKENQFFQDKKTNNYEENIKY